MGKMSTWQLVTMQQCMYNQQEPARCMLSPLHRPVCRSLLTSLEALSLLGDGMGPAACIATHKGSKVSGPTLQEWLQTRSRH